MLKSEIRICNGVPSLWIDGTPTSAMAYTTYFEERSCCADFAEAGYRIFFVNASFTASPINSTHTGFTPFRTGVFENPQLPDYSDFENAVYKILELCPNAVLFPRIYISMPKWWTEMHPDESVPTPKGGNREALFSEAFQRDGAALLFRFIQHVKSSDYADRIGGWQICGGQTQEWFHHDTNGSLGKAAEAPYHRWVKEHCGEDNATLPKSDDFLYNGFAKNEDENVKRYARFGNEAVAETIEYFAKTIKEQTNREQIVGTFYGYSFENGNSVLFGSHALKCLIDSTNLDFFSSPNAYTDNRSFGIDWADMMPVDSIKLHGKLAFIECDIRTHLTQAVQSARPGEYPDEIYKTKDGVSLWAGPPTPELSREALRKCFAHQITKASGIWWFDMWGGWYADPILMQDLAEMKNIYDRKAISGNHLFPSEAVLFSDERGYANLFSRSPHLKGIMGTRTAMGNTGVPYDSCMAEDADTVLKHYKAAVFPFPVPSEAGEHAIKLCEKMGVPYIRATAEHYELTTDEIRKFYQDTGIHFYTAETDVVYAGNGYVGLHSANGGMKRVRLPRPVTVSSIFGAEVPAQITDCIEFELKENATALFSVSQ